MVELLKDNLFVTHAMAGAFSVTLVTILTHPVDSIKTIMQVGSRSSKAVTASQAVRMVQSASGSFGILAGFEWALFRNLAAVGTRFGGYELLTAYYKDGRVDNFTYHHEAFMAGATAGMIESIVSSPLEIIKLRTQVISAYRLPRSTSIAEKGAIAPMIARLLPKYRPEESVFNRSLGLLSTLTSKQSNLIGGLKECPWMMSGSGLPPSVYHVRRVSDIISLEGWRGLWRGLRPGMFRDSLFGGVFCLSCEFICKSMLDYKAVHMDPIPSTNEDVEPSPPLAVSLAAGFSGVLAAAASHAFDTAKCRAQCIVLPKFISKERKLLRYTPPGSRFQAMAGIHPADKRILWRGAGLRMAQCGLASFVMAWSYFWAVDHFIST